MNNIYELALATVKLGGYALKDKLNELTAIMLAGQINVDEYTELTQLATQHANAEADPTETNILGALRTINAELVKIKERLAKLEEANDEAAAMDEYPAWARWDGLPTSGYKFGDKVTHLGVKYISNYVGLNVWEPGVQGTEALWTVIT